MLGAPRTAPESSDRITDLRFASRLRRCNSFSVADPQADLVSPMRPHSGGARPNTSLIDLAPPQCLLSDTPPWEKAARSLNSPTDDAPPAWITNMRMRVEATRLENQCPASPRSAGKPEEFPSKSFTASSTTDFAKYTGAAATERNHPDSSSWGGTGLETPAAISGRPLSFPTLAMDGQHISNVGAQTEVDEESLLAWAEDIQLEDFEEGDDVLFRSWAGVTPLIYDSEQAWNSHDTR